MKKSELITTISNVFEAIKSKKANLDHGSNPMDYRKNDLNLLDEKGRSELETKMTVYLKDYSARIKELGTICSKNKIKPIFVTQPKFDDTASYSWKVMQAYNHAMIEVCKSEHYDCINLANEMPKSLSLFYDQIHYTNSGAEKIAQILTPPIQHIINQNK